VVIFFFGIHPVVGAELGLVEIFIVSAIQRLCLPFKVLKLINSSLYLSNKEAQSRQGECRLCCWKCRWV
jgi:hypothetical protein